MGGTRLLIAGLAVLAVLGLVAAGAWALIGSLTPDDPASGPGTTQTDTPSGTTDSPEQDSPETPSPGEDSSETDSAEPGSSAATADAQPRTSDAAPVDESVPTVYVACLAEVCPVFLRVPGGDVLIDRDLTRGEQARYFEPRIDVVLGDAASVRVLVNGKERERGEEGERQTFTATRPTPKPS